MLHVACGCGHVSLVGEILGVGASRDPPIDPNTTNRDGRTPLCHAAYCGKEAVVRMLVGRSDVDVNKTGPLAISCMIHNTSVVAVLLECPRVDANLVLTSGHPSLNGQTALHVACEFRFLEGVKVLLQVNGIDTNCKNIKGETPLDVATRRKCTDICNLLKCHIWREKEKEIARITVENKRLEDTLREMNERVLILEQKLQEKEKRIQTLEEENSVLKACYKERAETMTSLVGANIDSFAMMKFLGSGSNAATFQVKFVPRGYSSVPQLSSSPATLQPLDNTKSDENNTPTMAMKVMFNWENTPQNTLIKQKYMKECIVLASVPLHPNVIHPLGTLVIPRFPPEFVDAIPSNQPVYKEFALNKSLAFLLPFCGVPLVKFLPERLSTTTYAATTTPNQFGSAAESSTRTVRNLLLQALSAVAHLERAHVVHRDIKGDNILVDPATLKLTLIDFGEAVECCSTKGDNEGELQATVMRTDGQVWGNTGTMPPEVSALSRDLMRMRGPSCVFSFAKCDSFSLALTFYDVMLPPTHKFIGRFKQDMYTFSTELLPPLPPQWNIDNNATLHTTPTTTTPSTTVVGTIAQVLVGMISRDRSSRVSGPSAATSCTTMGTIAQVLVGMMSRDRATRVSAPDALTILLHTI
ncbi:hypothetical protein Pelo_17220 [Pelomyxa schiedti]|nr:hypothetical protein Pelo_17220 [Pelomyxa schiedti]